MTHTSTATPRGRQLAVLTLGALGIVYGDIGTSPLYALRECFHGPHGIAATPDNILGVLSLIVWSLILIISIKYLVFVMRADNGGEGGILALIALVSRQADASRRSRAALIGVGLFGAALLYGDGMITPAISVLSAVEGLAIATHVFEPYIVPITVVILVGVFLIQSRGTAKVGALFGPVMVVWFTTLAVMGVSWIVLNPSVLVAVNPAHAVTFFVRNGGHGFVVLGSVFLVVTGGEALYADMGHFGARPIRLAWFGLAFPALVLNYLGQGAMLLQHPASASSPFFLMAPDWALYPLVILATMAAVIASQALISGVFSMTHQAMLLGYCPRMGVAHTSASHKGQIYIAQINWTLMVACLGLVIGFRSSTAMAAAYGIAVSLTMVITTLLTYLVARGSWGIGRVTASSLAGVFLLLEFGFVTANLTKFLQGGWFPLIVGVAIYILLSTWKQGRALLAVRFRERLHPLGRFLADIAANPPHRVSGTAVFMTSNSDGTPPTLLHNLQHNKILHEQIILLTVSTMDSPVVSDEDRLTVTPLPQGFFRVRACYGFTETPDVPSVLEQALLAGGRIAAADITYFLGTETLLATDKPGLPLWRERLFVLMSRNALRATTFFGIPPERVVELGMQVEL